MGVSWSSPRPTFLLGSVGFPCWVPAVRQKPRGLSLSILCLLSPTETLPSRAAWNQLPGKYQYIWGSNSRGSLGGEGKGRASSWHLPSPNWFPLQCPLVVAAHSPTSHATEAPHWRGGPKHPETDDEDRHRSWLVFLTFPSPAVHPGGKPPHPPSDHNHSPSFAIAQNCCGSQTLNSTSHSLTTTS